MQDPKKEALRMVRHWLKRCRELGVNVNGVNAERQKEGESEKGKEGEKKKDYPYNACAREAGEAFETFWKKYPSGRKIAKSKCRAKFLRLYGQAKNPADFTRELFAGLDRWLASRIWSDGFVCNPETFLNQERWLDFPEPSRAAASEKSRELDRESDAKAAQALKELGL